VIVLLNGIWVPMLLSGFPQGASGQQGDLIKPTVMTCGGLSG